MKTNITSKPPMWRGFANAMLKANPDGRNPPLEPKTEEQSPAELADFWAMTSAETSVSADEAEAMVAADDDLQAADAKGRAMPDRPVDIPLVLMCARVAKTFATPNGVNDLLKPGAMTVLHVKDGTDLTRLGDVVRDGMIPKRFRVVQTLQSAPQGPTVHCGQNALVPCGRKCGHQGHHNVQD